MSHTRLASICRALTGSVRRANLPSTKGLNIRRVPQQQRHLSYSPIMKFPTPSMDPPKHEMAYFPDMTTSLPSESAEFRRVLYTGLYSQLVLMTVPVGGDIGDEVGIDLVAMCVNDVLVQGAEPLFFLDYFATGVLKVDEASEVVSGIAKGCIESGCALVGGETAEMPGMYQSGEYDIAGFCVGAVERNAILPKIDQIAVGDLVIGLTSSGIHSNGYSLVRHLLKKHESSINIFAEPPFPSQKNFTRLIDVLLAPTKLYIKPVLPLMKKNLIKAAAHITGGGLLDNIPRVLPSDKAVEIDMLKWTVPPVFHWLS